MQKNTSNLAKTWRVINFCTQNALKRQKETPKTLYLQGFREFFVLFPLAPDKEILNNSVQRFYHEVLQLSVLSTTYGLSDFLLPYCCHWTVHIIHQSHNKINAFAKISYINFAYIIFNLVCGTIAVRNRPLYTVFKNQNLQGKDFIFPPSKIGFYRSTFVTQQRLKTLILCG